MTPKKKSFSWEMSGTAELDRTMDGATEKVGATMTAAMAWSVGGGHGFQSARDAPCGWRVES
jgi:hypothetical protein